MWIGSASSLRLEDRFWLLRFLRTDDDFNTPLQQLATDLGELDVRHVQRRLGREEAADVDWDGTVLLISPRPVSE
ncbi:hypothetical protein MNBD_GAMMA14-415 [hydrothermal vent metagenome]|uniref:Uncharacterized protein n=1 Tax=hydrothermal vent metagenome TaxID=652676 RepID=A0A3B0YUI0_9ZZZZ